MSSSLDIAFFGSSLLSAYWNGAATYYRGLIRALDQRGHRVVFFEPDAFDRQAHRDLEPPPWAQVVVYPATPEGVARSLAAARSADVVVKASGVGVFDELLEREVLEERRPEALVVFWDVDAPATLERLQNDPGDAFRPLVPRYDLVLTYGGGEPVVSAYRQLGARDCVPIYNALDPETHFPVPAQARFAADLSLLANRLPDREERIAEFFLRPARQLPHQRFLLGGSGWEGAGLPANVQAVGHVGTADHNAWNGSARAVLNVNRASMARFGYSPATRIFEAAGAGACLVSDRWPGLDLFLEEDREVLVADDGEAVAEHLAGLTPARAAAIGEAARRRVLAHHTYAHRALQVEAVLIGARRMEVAGAGR